MPIPTLRTPKILLALMACIMSGPMAANTRAAHHLYTLKQLPTLSRRSQAIALLGCAAWYSYHLYHAQQELKRMQYIVEELETLTRSDTLEASIYADRAQRQLVRSLIPLCILALQIAIYTTIAPQNPICGT